MNLLDNVTSEEERKALVEGEFKRLVKYNAHLGEEEKKHLLASSAEVLKLAQESLQNLYDVPTLPSDLYVMNIVSSIFGTMHSYIFVELEHAIASARWYAVYADWIKKNEKDVVTEQTGDGEAFRFRIIDHRSGDSVVVSLSRLNYTSIASRIGTA